MSTWNHPTKWLLGKHNISFPKKKCGQSFCTLTGSNVFRKARELHCFLIPTPDWTSLWQVFCAVKIRAAVKCWASPQAAYRISLLVCIFIVPMPSVQLPAYGSHWYKCDLDCPAAVRWTGPLQLIRRTKGNGLPQQAVRNYQPGMKKTIHSFLSVPGRAHIDKIPIFIRSHPQERNHFIFFLVPFNR